MISICVVRSHFHSSRRIPSCRPVDQVDQQRDSNIVNMSVSVAEAAAKPVLFSPDEEIRWKQSVHWDDIPTRRELILIVGPAAAGKTFLLDDSFSSQSGHNHKLLLDAHDTFDEDGDRGASINLADFVVLDGDGMREQRRLSSTTSQTHEAMKPVVAAFKRKIIQQGIEVGKNFILPLTFSTDENWEQLKHFGIDCSSAKTMLEANGAKYTCPDPKNWGYLVRVDFSYTVRRMFCVLAPYEVLLDRIKDRGARTGRQQNFSVQKFDQTLDGIRRLLQHLKVETAEGIRLIGSGGKFSVGGGGNGGGRGKAEAAGGRIILDYRSPRSTLSEKNGFGYDRTEGGLPLRWSSVWAGTAYTYDIPANSTPEKVEGDGDEPDGVPLFRTLGVHPLFPPTGPEEEEEEEEDFAPLPLCRTFALPDVQLLEEVEEGDGSAISSAKSTPAHSRREGMRKTGRFLRLSGQELDAEKTDVIATLDLALDLFESEETRLKKFLVRQFL